MNKFEEEIVRLNKERDERLAEIGEKIGRLEVQNANMNQLRAINVQQVQALRNEKNALIRSYKLRKHEIVKGMDEHYAEKLTESFLGKMMHGFFVKHPEVYELWKAYKAEAEGGAQ